LVQNTLIIPQWPYSVHLCCQVPTADAKLRCLYWIALKTCRQICYAYKANTNLTA